MSDVKYNKCLRIVIEDGGVFITDKRVEMLFPKELYRKNSYYDKELKRPYIRINDEEPPEDKKFTHAYEFHETIPGIYNMLISRHFIQMDLTDVESDAYIDIIRKIYDVKEWKDWIRTIRGIRTKLYEGFIALTYEDLAEYKTPHLLEKMPEDECDVGLSRKGDVDEYRYIVTRHMYRCQASCFDMADCISFTNEVILESLAAPHCGVETVDDILSTIEKAKKIMNEMI